MGMLDYLQENWRDIYKPFQRYPEIYGEHARQGMSMLREDAPGAWDIATKPLGALMMSGIPSLYEAFRDEPIRNTLIDDLGIDPKKADYATQAIGLGMDVGVPYAVIRKGLTPWISEQVAKQANPTGFSPSRRRFLKGAGATAVGTATGIPVLKQVAKQAPDFFADLATNVAGSLKNVTTEKALLSGYGSKFEPVLNVLARMRVSTVDKKYPMGSSYRQLHRPRNTLPDRPDDRNYGSGYSDTDYGYFDTPGGVDVDKVTSELSDKIGHLATRGNESMEGYIDDIYYSLHDLGPMSDLYKSNPKEFVSTLNKEIKWLESRVKSEKPTGLRGVDWEKIKKSDTPTQYFDPVSDQVMTYNPSLLKKWEAELKAAKDLLKELG